MHCCIPTPTTDNKTSTGMIWITLNMPSAVEECREPSGKCSGIWHCLESDDPDYYYLLLLPPRTRHSSDAALLDIPRIHTELARRAFSVAAPSTWHSLPADIWLCENIHFQTPLENPSIQTHLVLLCCIKRLCVFGPNRAIQIRYYYYYW